MNETQFTAWLQANGLSKKCSGDCVSRLKRVEHSIANCDIDREYTKDRCQYLLSLFLNKGENSNMQKNHIGNLPIGKMGLQVFSYAIRKYVQFRITGADKKSHVKK